MLHSETPRHNDAGKHCPRSARPRKKRKAPAPYIWDWPSQGSRSNSPSVKTAMQTLSEATPHGDRLPDTYPRVARGEKPRSGAATRRKDRWSSTTEPGLQAEWHKAPPTQRVGGALCFVRCGDQATLATFLSSPISSSSFLVCGIAKNTAAAIIVKMSSGTIKVPL